MLIGGRAVAEGPTHFFSCDSHTLQPHAIVSPHHPFAPRPPRAGAQHPRRVDLSKSIITILVVGLIVAGTAQGQEARTGRLRGEPILFAAAPASLAQPAAYASCQPVRGDVVRVLDVVAVPFGPPGTPNANAHFNVNHIQISSGQCAGEEGWINPDKVGSP